MPTLPTTEKLEKSIPYIFLATWLVCGTSLFLAARHWKDSSDHSAAPAVRRAEAAVSFGYLAAGVVVSLLSVAHCCARGTVPIFVAGDHKNGTVPFARSGTVGELTEGRLRLWFLLLLAAAAAALSVDCRLAHWCLSGNCPRLLHDLLEPCAVFGHAIGALLVMLAIYQIDPPRRRALWWVLGCVLLSGAAANGVKSLVERTRPVAFDFQGDVWTTFGRWLPPTIDYQSFPSGHTAGAAGLALALAALYPRGRRLFLLLVVLVACQRMECGAHFLSDVLSGAAISCLTVACCLRLGSWFSVAGKANDGSRQLVSASPEGAGRGENADHAAAALPPAS